MGGSSKKKKSKLRINDLASYAIVFAGVFALLHYLENFFKPIIVALIIWYIIRELSRQLAKIKIKGWTLPFWVRSILSFLIIVAFGYSSIQIVIFNIESLLEQQ
jgi:predicted PurR-regulated permease PerM